MRLGATALRWSDHRLLIASPGRIEWLDGSHLVVATGTRPGTPAELRLHGGRLGGVLNATVATHLLDARVMLGRRPAIVGMSDWAREVADRLHAVGLRVPVVSDVDAPRPDYADEWWPGWTATQAIGHARVEELRLSRSGQEARLLCDAVILAGGIRPVRNIEGAIASGVDVTFVQVSEPHVPAASLVVEARRAADEIRSKDGRVSR